MRGEISLSEGQLWNLKNDVLVMGLHEEYLHEFMKPTEDPKTLIKKTGEQLGLDLGFMFTYGAGIGALVGPTSDILSGQYPEMNEVQLASLVIAAVGVVVIGNNVEIQKLVRTFKEEGISGAFDKVLTFISSFESIMESVLNTSGMVVRGLSKILSFSFIVPVVGIISQIMIDMGGSINQMEDIVSRMIAYLATISIGEGFASVIEKLNGRFSKKGKNLEEQFLMEHNNTDISNASRVFPEEMFQKWKKLFNKILLSNRGGWGTPRREYLIYISQTGKIGRIETSPSANIKDIPFEEFETYNISEFTKWVDENGFEIRTEGKFV